ncbi:MAG: DUF5003 domain-containing protein [Alistipes sp.]|nr:DUF5003 domain-containing protein [Alistipes sp.]
MKSLRKLLSMVLVVAVALGAISCSESEEVTPQLPDMKTIKCSAGDRPELVFTTQNNWRLSSDAVWCKFKTSGGDLQDISGRAGTHKITLVIGNEQIKDRVTTANITIIMGSNKAVIATVEREPDHYYLKVYDITGTPTTDKVIKISYGGYTPVLIEANFDFAAVEYPDWIDIREGSISGVAGEQVEAYLRIVPNGDRERFPIKKEDGHVITFSDINRSEDKTFSCPIIYSGMGDYEIVIEGPTENEFGWEVTPDGKSFSQITADGSEVTFENELLYNIVAQKNVYYMVYIENIIERGMPSYKIYTEGDDFWMHFDKERMALTVDPASKLRYGYAMALPQGYYNFISVDLKDDFLFETDNSSGIDLPVLKNDYLKYIATSLTQRSNNEADPETQMHIYHSITTYDIPATRYTDAGVKAYYGVEEAYTAPFINSIPDREPCIVINPRIEGWSTANYENGEVGVDVWYKGELLKMSDKEYYIGENVDELLSLQLYGPKSGFEIGGENIYVVFKVGGEAKKLLVVTPPTK